MPRALAGLAAVTHATALSLTLSLAPCAGTLEAQSLANAHLRATFGPRGLAAVTDLADQRTIALGADDFSVTIGTQRYDGAALPAPVRRAIPNGAAFRYRAGDLAIDVAYELRRDWHFVSKRVSIVAPVGTVLRVNDITLVRATLGEAPADVFRPASARPSLGTHDYGAAVRFADGHSLLVVAQNPFLQFTLEGRAAELRYAPEMDWESRYGPWQSDRALIAPVRLSGRRLAAQMTPEWREVGEAAPGLDEVEVAAFTGMVRAFLAYEPVAPVNVFVGWCANDYQIDVGTAAGRAEYRRLFDQAAAVGAQYVLYAPSNSALSRREESVDAWSWEHVLWLGLGQKIRRDEWNPRTSAIPASVQEMLDHARRRQLKLLAYVYPVLPFTQEREWLVPSRSDPRKAVASLGNRALQDWLVDQLVAFHDRTGIGGYAFDYTFLNYDGTSRYAQWWGWRRVMEELRRRVPGIVIDGRQAYHQYGPWSWLAGSYPHPTFNDEQPESFTPYPDLHFDRVSANRERYTAYRYRNYEFTPSELVPGFMTHQTSRSDESNDMPALRTTDRGVVLTSFRARDWDYLGWRYSVLSSIAVGGWNNVINMIPARDSAEHASFSAADRAWLRGWIAWTATHKELLRRTRTILGQPALGKIDGTSAIDRDHGFVFLFNPDAQRLTARLPLDPSIGVTARERYELVEVHPLAGRRVAKRGEGYWRRGDTVTVELDGGSALVLELAPAPPAVREPVVFGTTGSATVRGGVLTLLGARGEAGTTAHLVVALPPGTPVTQATVNGVSVALDPRRGEIAEFDVRFAGAEFRAMQPVVMWEPSFEGGRVSGTFTIPRRIFEQLAERRRAWPIPWTAEDFRTTWLAPERLLLFAPFSAPDDKWEATLTIDGAPVELRKAYTAVRAVRSTFTGFYADLSRLEPDRTYRFTLDLPALKPGQFRGLYFENVEPAWVSSIASP